MRTNYIEPNIHKGMKITYCNPEAGYPGDQVNASSKLKLNAIYTIKAYNMGNFHTHVYLEEVDGVFNSVMFGTVDDNS